MSFCGAIEMVRREGYIMSRPGYDYNPQAGIITFSCSIIKNGIEKFALKQPIFLVRLLSGIKAVMSASFNDACPAAFPGRPYVLR